jgi:hypothetical protein
MPEILTIDGTWYCSVCAKNYNPKSKTVNLKAIYIKVCFVHFLSLSELWRAKVTQRTIRSQLKKLSQPEEDPGF